MSRRSLFAASLAAGLGVVAFSALAPAGQDGAPPKPAVLDEAGEDVPGAFVVDLIDSMEESAVGTLFAELGVPFVKTALEATTRVEVAQVAAADVPGFLAKLGTDPRVDYVEPLSRYSVRFVPDDPMFDEQWHLARVDARRAWDFSTGRGVTVAVIDTGIACEDFGEFSRASDLASTRCVDGFNFVDEGPHASDDHGHGTHVAGTIAQSTDNGLGAAGLAFDARLMPIKVLDSSGWGTTTTVADGIRWAADHGAQVINLSLGGPRKSRLLERAVAHARGKGVVVVAAAGNTGGPAEYPGATEGVVGVAASDRDDRLARFSARGPGVDLTAPGVDVLQQSICNHGRDRCERFPLFNGSSMAAPHVAGAAALLVSLGVTDPAVVEDLLKTAARPAESDAFGAGLLDAAAALEHVAIRQTALRLGALVVVMLLAYRWAKRRRALGILLGPRALFAALLSGPGLLFFVPLLGSRHHDAVDLLARPLGDWDLVASASWHRFMPLATAVLPLLLAALLLKLRGIVQPIVGLCLGTTAYLVSAGLLGYSELPFGGRLGTLAWCAVNAVACLFLARLLLREAHAH